jgi:hypothetical protein
MTPPAENAAFIAAIAVAAIIFFAVSALANRVICLTPQCMGGGCSHVRADAAAMTDLPTSRSTLMLALPPSGGR